MRIVGVWGLESLLRRCTCEHWTERSCPGRGECEQRFNHSKGSAKPSSNGTSVRSNIVSMACFPAAVSLAPMSSFTTRSPSIACPRPCQGLFFEPPLNSTDLCQSQLLISEAKPGQEIYQLLPDLRTTIRLAWHSEMPVAGLP